MLVCAVTAIFSAALFAQSPPAPAAIDQFARLQGELRRTHESGDAAAYLATAQSMYSFLNGSPLATLQLMSAESFAGKADEALRRFSQFVATYIAYQRQYGSREKALQMMAQEYGQNIPTRNRFYEGRGPRHGWRIRSH
jgi:hypothetical protein